MNAPYIVSLLFTLGLGVYLFVALFKPELF